MVCVTTFIFALAAAAVSLATPLDENLYSRNPNFVLGLEEDGLSKRQSYSSHYTTGGTVNYSPGSAGSYTLSCSGAADFVVGKGWNPGSASPVTYAGTFSATGGTLLFTLYGWTTDPLTEWYVVEDYNSNPGGGGSSSGTVDSDGGTYNIYITQHNNQPSIQGTSNFKQVKSVRTSTRTSGTITLQNHIDAWKKAGFDMGTFNYEIMATEGWGSASGSTALTSLSH